MADFEIVLNFSDGSHHVKRFVTVESRTDFIDGLKKDGFFSARVDGTIDWYPFHAIIRIVLRTL